MRTVLFVCVENTFRSVLSEELFNSRSPPGWRAESAGVSPAAAVNPVVKELLKEVGVTLTERTPQVVTPEMVARASRVVTFGCLDRCPIGAEGKGEDWPVPGATGKTPAQLREIRDDLSRRVDDLIARYSISPSKPAAPAPGDDRVPSAPDLKAVRGELLKAAKSRGKVTYGELMKLLDVSRGKPLFDAIVAVDREEYSQGAPGFAAIIVRKDTGFPGGGFFCDDDLPQSVRRPFSRASDPKLSAAEMNYVKEAQRKIWEFYSGGRAPAETLD
jgi:arsenate reductase (thioredoxin)